MSNSVIKNEGSRRPLKEKIVQIYEAFFRGEDPSLDNINFWDEYFLLRPNLYFLESQFEAMTYEEISSLKETINNLFYQCVRILKDGNQIRCMNAIQTLCALVHGVYGKAPGDYGFDVINLLIGFSSAEHLMQTLIERLSHILCNEYPSNLKSLVLKFLLILVTIESMFVSEEREADKLNIRANNAVLLALYEVVHLNRNFLITLTHCQVDASGHLFPISSEPILYENSFLSPSKVENELPPSNLLVTFLEFSSIIMLNTKDESNVNTCKLCFIILTCITEDQYANSIIHDVNLVYKVQLHRMPMRHRKVCHDRNGSFQPLACPMLDLMVEFILSHMTKIWSCVFIEIYGSEKGRVRLQYQWKELWTALITLIKFLMTQEALLAKNCNIFNLSIQVMNTLNLFITFGDTFLPSPSCYDELYYEIVRMNHVFDNLYSLTLRYTTCDGEWKEYAAKLMNSLVNVRAIINHFTPKIESVLADNGLSALTEDQVLDVVRNNYDTLTLKLYDNLDQYEKYTEKPIESAFFTPLVRSIITEYRTSLNFKSLEMQRIMKEFSIIS
ncbi:Armadillo-like helical domain-containing [Argiope bruennichi]|uniref:Armadillo-like helical domain-containing n=1 Tax=Argiope bruennichi TaxID=94029 RepID=A0A8T0F3S5_ARGBR|nr:Armadillo-like helical domain-containing [Argiope bruennichi]